MSILFHTPRGRARDGRNIDPELGRLAGEGAQQRVEILEAPPEGERVLQEVPSAAISKEAPTYYGVPTLKEPVWNWYIPAYFYVGGVAGASGVLGAAAGLLRHRGTEDLSRRCRLLAIAGAVASAALLVADLGRPERFLNMLRVFRPTSPMNMGTWILTGFGACAGVAALPAMLPVGDRLERTGKLASIGAGLIGLPLTGYTGVLIANTAVPLWQGTRRALPVLFSASGAASVASLFEMFPPRYGGEEVAHRFALGAKAAELAMTVVLEREAAAVPRVARPLRSGFSGALWRMGQGLATAGLVLSLVGRPARFAAGAAGTAGALAIRFALLLAGKRSARDPRATFDQQRAGRGAADVVGKRRAAPLPAALRQADRPMERDRELHP